MQSLTDDHEMPSFALRAMDGKLCNAKFGGTDGTRTRDLRRDRPAF